ncbi:MAG: serine hydroxymethyltransferase, partial [Candidatus Jacksonbacteria bacterium]
NMIPFDARTPFDPSGIRLGTPALTSRGMKKAEMKTVGELIGKVLKNVDDNDVKREVASAVKKLTGRFPIYAWLI